MAILLDDPEFVTPLEMESAACCICGGTDGEPIGVGEDFEYRSSTDSFLAVRCPHCTLVYLDPAADAGGAEPHLSGRLPRLRVLGRAVRPRARGAQPAGGTADPEGAGRAAHGRPHPRRRLRRRVPPRPAAHPRPDGLGAGGRRPRQAGGRPPGWPATSTIHHGTVEGLDLPACVLRRRPHDPDDRARRPSAGGAGRHQAAAEAGRPADDRHRQHGLAGLPAVVPAVLGRLPLPPALEPVQRALDPAAGGQDRLRGGVLRDHRVAGELDVLGPQRPRRRRGAPLAGQPVQPEPPR